MRMAGDISTKARELLLQYRWLVVVLMGVMSIIFELAEHLPSSEPFNAHFWREIVLFGLLFPGIGGAILSLLSHTEADRRRVSGQFGQVQDFSRQLISTLNWGQLTDLIVRFPGSIVPLSGAVLMMRHPKNNTFAVETEWWSPEVKNLPPVTSRITDDYCVLCVGRVQALHRETCNEALTWPEPYDVFCLPLYHRTDLIALLHFYLPLGSSLSAEQERVLNHLAPSMALALAGARSRQEMDHVQAAATTAERRRIARHLHDSLAQNIGYLRLKLDQLTLMQANGGDNALRDDLAQMRDIANEAYEQVRGTLSVLHPYNDSDLTTALLNHARFIARRAGFEVQLITYGQPRTLPTPMQQQIFYLFQEALANVEKHAEASTVDIMVKWLPVSLVIELKDDGQGFDRDGEQQEGHYGLGIMQERAGEVNGRLEIRSVENEGTTIHFELPLASVRTVK